LGLKSSTKFELSLIQRIITDIRVFKHKYPLFFYINGLVILVYFFQFLVKTEITPLGYFSLYSQAAVKQKTYSQNLPFNQLTNQPIDIYNSKGTAFLMHEIVTTRYEILGNSSFCNPQFDKAKKLYLPATNDCGKLQEFKKWYYQYCINNHIQVPSFDYFTIKKCYFSEGKLISFEDVEINN